MTTTLDRPICLGEFTLRLEWWDTYSLQVKCQVLAVYRRGVLVAHAVHTRRQVWRLKAMAN